MIKSKCIYQKEDLSEEHGKVTIVILGIFYINMKQVTN